MAKVKKDKSGYGYKYADLSDVNELVDNIHGSYWQFTKTDEVDGKVYVWTHRNADDLVDHAIELRGAEVVQAMLSNGKMNPAQAAGSALTYARRYSLYMAYGIACVDDDAESLTIPPESVDMISKDFTAAVEQAPKVANRSAARSAIIKYCREHRLDITEISELYGIEKGMSEQALTAKLDMIKKDYEG